MISINNNSGLGQRFSTALALGATCSVVLKSRPTFGVSVAHIYALPPDRLGTQIWKTLDMSFKSDVR